MPAKDVGVPFVTPTYGLGTFGSYLTKLQPDFDARLYGFKKLSDLVKAKTDIFRFEERSTPGSGVKVLYVRVREK